MVAKGGDKNGEKNPCDVKYGNNALGAPTFGGVSVRSRNGARNGAPSRKGCVVDGQRTFERASNRLLIVRTPPPGSPIFLLLVVI